ncbi:MAG TPA: beta-phosphoglucomutase [Oleiagrimonas sp.]|nr:beta-phosphoglucomutase [Oleiagrimonas sp.]
MPQHASDAATVDPWRLVRTHHKHHRAAHHASVFALSNGRLGVRDGLEEAPTPDQASFLAGVWESTPIDYHERMPGLARHTNTRLPVADGTRIELQLGAQSVRLDDGEWLDFEQMLDLGNGCSRRHLRWRSPAGATLAIDVERIVPWTADALLCIRYRVRSIDYDGPVTLNSKLRADIAASAQGDDPRVGVSPGGGLTTTHCHADATDASIGQKTTYSHIGLACAQHHRLPDERLTFASASTQSDGVHQSYRAELHPGDSVTLEKYVAYAWSKPGQSITHDALLDKSRQQLDHVLDSTFDQQLAVQGQCCADFWNDVDLAIDDDPASEQALRVNLFHLRQSMADDGLSTAAAKGLTGEGYGGHHFWDSEVFMLPALVNIAPTLARGILAYRVRTLDNARAHAREMDHARGALYPWRTINGDECSAYFPAGSAQYHINADIAFALKLYVDATGDEAFLLDGGAEVLIETARLWLEVGGYNTRRGDAFCINQVTGPDEYTVLVDNDYYTNRMAQKHLEYAAEVVDWLASTHADAYRALTARIRLHADEAIAWRHAANAMYLPSPDPQLGVLAQDDTFLQRPAAPASLVCKNPGKPLLLDFHPLTIYRHQVCKQADVLHALVLAGDDTSIACRRLNFDYYEAITTHDSTLSLPVFSIAAAQAGAPHKAWNYFQQTLRIDLDDLHGNTSHGVHLAAMAGSWMALTWGFGGLVCQGDVPRFAPTLPPAASGYQFGFRWRGSKLRIAVQADAVTYTLMSGPALEIRHHDQRVVVEPGHPVRFALPARTHPGGALKGVIFDLDGVLADTATVHHAAWKKLAEELDLPFDDSLGWRLKGVDRMTSLDMLLEGSGRTYSDAEKASMAARKNDYYRQQIERFGPVNLLPGARRAVQSTRRAGLKTALASASRNAPLLLERLGIGELFDYVVDAGRIERHKPDPEIFLAAARGLGVAPTECLGVEDAAAGVAAIHAAGMPAVGIGRGDELNDADITLGTIADFDISRLLVDTHQAQEAAGHRPGTQHNHHRSGRVSA